MNNDRGIADGRWSPKMPDKYVEEQKAEEEESPWDDEDNDDNLRIQ